MAALSIVLIVTGFLVRLLSKSVGSTLTGIGAISLAATRLRGQIIGDIFYEDTRTAASWRAGIVVLATFLIFPGILLELGTSGSVGSGLVLFSGWTPTHGPFGLPELLCLSGGMLTLVFMPARMRARDVPWSEDSRVPGLVAGIAAVFSGAYIFLQHFGGGPLDRSTMGATTVAAFALAVLVTPFYRGLANACWKSGVVEVFDPVHWWQAWSDAWAEYRGSGGPVLVTVINDPEHGHQVLRISAAKDYEQKGDAAEEAPGGETEG